MNDEIEFQDTSAEYDAEVQPWRILVADDEKDVHRVTNMVLQGFRFKDRPLELLHAYSAREACEIFNEHSDDIAVVFMDVVMETNDAGLQAVKFIREEVGNSLVRIILRTGQPGVAPEREVVLNYSIDDYREKTELSSVRLKTIVHTALASYQAARSVIDLNEQLNEANRDLEQFAYAASHDLKAPLRQIGTFAGFLRESLGDDLDGEQLQSMDMIDAGVKNMTALLTDLLELSRVGRSNAELGEVACDEALDEALDNVGLEITERQVVIQREPLPVLHNASYRYWVQLFQNLVSNALKFQPGDKPEVSISAHQADNRWIIAVADKGIGIPEDKVERIFAPFYRLHGDKEYAGTGIGLALCKKVAEFHHGKIWAESKPGEGTTISISVPATHASITQQ